MSWALVVIVIVTIALIVVIAALYWYASRLKRSFDAPSPAALAAQPPLVFDLSQASADSLAHLSREPILIRQAEDGLRVQLDNRPLVPIAILTDRARQPALRGSLDCAGHAGRRRLRLGAAAGLSRRLVRRPVRRAPPVPPAAPPAGLPRPLRRRPPGFSVGGVYRVVDC